MTAYLQSWAPAISGLHAYACTLSGGTLSRLRFRALFRTLNFEFLPSPFSRYSAPALLIFVLVFSRSYFCTRGVYLYTHEREKICVYIFISKTGQAEQDRHNWTGRTEQVELDR